MITRGAKQPSESLFCLVKYSGVKVKGPQEPRLKREPLLLRPTPLWQSQPKEKRRAMEVTIVQPVIIG